MLNRFLSAAGIALALISAGPARADYPDRPIKFVLPFAPGQGTDVATRMVTGELQKRLGQPVVIENRPGGGGIIAIQQVQKSPPDGYTVLGFSSSFLSNAAFHKQLPYDLGKDFIPVIRTVTSAVVLVVHPSVPVNTVAELVEYTRKNAGQVSYASAGNSTTMHLVGEMLKSRTGAQMEHVPYKGDPAALNDLLGGQIKVGISGFAAALPHIRAGKIKPIAVSTPDRIDTMPHIPTIAETLTGFELVGWLAYMVPAGTPASVVAKLHDNIRAVIDQPATRDQMANLGMIVSPKQTPAELRGYVESTGKQIVDVIRSANIQQQ